MKQPSYTIRAFKTGKEHFKVNADATLFGLTPEGRATVGVLRINAGQRRVQRQALLLLGDYPGENM